MVRGNTDSGASLELSKMTQLQCIIRKQSMNLSSLDALDLVGLPSYLFPTLADGGAFGYNL